MSVTESAIDLDGVTLRGHVTGDGPTVVFVHGAWVAGPLWDDVVARLDGMRRIVPTWPLARTPIPRRPPICRRGRPPDASLSCSKPWTWET
jgi:hypothetical protein